MSTKPTPVAETAPHPTTHTGTDGAGDPSRVEAQIEDAHRDEWARSEGDINRTPARAAFLKTIQGESTDWLERDEGVFLHQSLSTPCLTTLASAQGVYLEDVDGRRYIDFHGNSVHQLGYGHPAVIAAATEAMATLPFSPRRFTNRYAIQCAERLTQLSGLSRVLFAPSGTAAMGMALKVARLATGKAQTLSLWDSFHGASLDAISIGGEALFRKHMGPLLPGTHHVPPCDPKHCVHQCGAVCSTRCADLLDYVLSKEPDIGAVIIETVRCTDVQIPPRDYFKKVRASCDRYGALLVLDEIPIGLGRTGKMFAYEHYGIQPDLLVLGKGLGGGLWPMAALLATERLNVGQEVALGHYTHEKSSVGSAVALATLDVIEKDELCARATVIGNRLREALLAMPLALDVRVIGALVGAEILDPDPARAMRLAEAVLYECLQRGLSFKIGQGQVLTLVPPLTITDAELNDAIDILTAAMHHVVQTQAGL